MRALALAVAAVCSFCLRAGAQTEPSVKAMDVYRSQTLTPARARAEASPLLGSYLRARLEHHRGNQKVEARLKAQVEAKLKKSAGLAFLSISVNDYVTSANRTWYVTFDAVDAADAKTRMPFRAAPSGRAPDPEGLLAAWQQYSDAGDALAQKGLLDMSAHPNCPGFFCLWGSKTPELKQLEQKLEAGAVSGRTLLEKTLADDAEPRKRAAALFVLSYLKDGKDVVELCYAALEDPSEDVRSASLQILAEVALYHKTVFLDVGKIVPALDYPTVSDRAKALSVLVGLADNPSYRPTVLTRGTPYLLGLLRLQQPANHDLAFTLLAMLSQQSYDQRDYDSWRKWVESQSKGAVEVPGVSADDAR